MLFRSNKEKIMKLFMLLSICLVFFLSYQLINEKGHQYIIDDKLILGGQIERPESDNLRPIETKKDLSLIFGGDIMLSRTVNAKMRAYNDYAWPARLIASTTQQADISVFNLESPFLKNSNYTVLTGSFAFKVNPLAVQTLSLLGVDVLSLANNHLLNAGEQGVIDTLDILADNNILSVGAGLSEIQARKAVIIEKKGWKLAFLAYAYPNDTSVASETRAGIATMNLKNLEADIKDLEGKVDLIIVLMHAGIEYVAFPQNEQVNFAHRAIDSGADLVIGHHPHWPQAWEIYNDKAIFYSLGNFIFDQMWSEGTSQGLLLEIIFQDDLSAKARFVPIVIKNYGQVELWPEGKDQTIFWSTYDLEGESEISWGRR